MIAVLRVSRPAIDELRSLLSRYLADQGAREGQLMEDTDLDSFELAGFLLAALAYARDSRPLLGRGGETLDAPEEPPWQLVFTLTKALSGLSELVAVERYLDVLQLALPFAITEQSAGRGRPRARVYSCPLRGEMILCDAEIGVFGAVAGEGWMGDAARREEVFSAIIGPNGDASSFVEIGEAQAIRLGSVILAGRGYQEEGPSQEAKHAAQRSVARQLLRIFGDRTRAFALTEAGARSAELPSVSWCAYDAQGNGSWGTRRALVVTDGVHAAGIDVLWDVTSE